MGIRLDNARYTTQYIGRYTKRPVLAQSRIKEYDGKYVTFEYEDKAEEMHKLTRMTVEEFIARLIIHIPDKGFRQIRHYGMYATRRRKTDLARARELLKQPPPAEVIPVNWRQRRKLQNGGYDPLICHRCGIPLVLAAVAYRSRDGPLIERTFDN